MNQVSELLKELVPHKGKSNAAVAAPLGISGQLLGQYINGRQEPKLNFYKKWKEIYGEDLLEMLETNVSQGTLAKDDQPYIDKRRDLKNNHSKKIPYYDAEAAGGIMETEMTPIHAPAGTIDVGDLLHDSQAAIRIYGNSMLPNYPPGCVVGLVKVENGFIQPGEVYVLETRNQRVLKRLFYREDDPDSEHLLCYSDNIMKFEGGARDGKLAYPPFPIPKKDIINLFIVTGVIKRNTNSVIINR